MTSVDGLASGGREPQRHSFGISIDTPPDEMIRRAEDLLAQKRQQHHDRKKPREDKGNLLSHGLVQEIYNMLWSRTATGRTCYKINLPDTVIIEGGELVAWYFSSTQQEEILMKSSKNLLSDNIMNKWSARNRNLPASAMLLWPDVDVEGHEPEIYLKPTPHPQVQGVPVQGRSSPVTAVRYLTSASLRTFLETDFRPWTGVLQRFVGSIGYGNTMIRAMWNPAGTDVEIRENTYRMTDESESLETRMSTFEGAIFLSQTQPPEARPELHQLVKEHCQAIADHIHEIFTGVWAVTEMTLYFKLDDQERLWFLFCTSLQMSGPGAVSAEDRPMSIRTAPLATQVKSQIASKSAHGSFLCCHCGRVSGYDDRKGIDFFTIIHEYQSKVGLEPDDRRRDWLMQQIPPGIARTYRSLSRNEYNRVKDSINFQHRTAEVCKSCHSSLAAFRALWIEQEEKHRRDRLRQARKEARETLQRPSSPPRPLTGRTDRSNVFEAEQGDDQERRSPRAHETKRKTTLFRQPRAPPAVIQPPLAVPPRPPRRLTPEEVDMMADRLSAPRKVAPAQAEPSSAEVQQVLPGEDQSALVRVMRIYKDRTMEPERPISGRAAQRVPDFMRDLQGALSNDELALLTEVVGTDALVEDD
ncbi:unnamed protein product [Pedinophyceae sp. YPF-701]|nr:unnamed protein product [Pedinophyceae sp. YPF-701]